MQVGEFLDGSYSHTSYYGSQEHPTKHEKSWHPQCAFEEHHVYQQF